MLQQNPNPNQTSCEQKETVLWETKTKVVKNKNCFYSGDTCISF